MKKSRKILLILLFVFILFNSNVFANNGIKATQFSKEYVQWLQMPEEERAKVIEPRMYEIPKTTVTYSNPLRFTRMIGSSIVNGYTLKDDIPENVIVKNQNKTQLCWAFASLSSLETNLALRDLKLNKEQKIEYNFSAKHMDYSTVYYLNNEQVNKYGINRRPTSMGNIAISTAYLTNGLGAIDEEDMEFDYEDKEEIVTLSEISAVDSDRTQVYDTIEYPAYDVTEDLTQIKTQIKDHIKNYGSVIACIHGTDMFGTDGKKYYNNKTGAIYCNNKQTYPIDHAVSIIGWDDDYAIENFSEESRPKNKGAWIIKNSYGTRSEEYEDLDEFKTHIFETLKDNESFKAMGFEEASDIPDEYAKNLAVSVGYKTQEDGLIYYPIGNDGFMYVSYEDVNIYTMLSGIVKADDEVSYENIYQYNETINNGQLQIDETSKAYVANIFEKKTEDDEFISQVSIYTPEKCTCKVYVNQNGESLKAEDLGEAVNLEAGKTETIEAGYHTLEFAKPIKIKSNKFAVVVEIQGTRENKLNISVETNFKEVDETQYSENDQPTIKNLKELYKNIELAEGKCFIKYGENDWIQMSKLVENGKADYNCDSIIKAFTVSDGPDDSLKEIQITKLPTKLEGYVEGDELNLEGIEVTAYFNDDTSRILKTEEYTVDITKLEAGDNTITVTFEEETDSFEVIATKKDDPKPDPDPETKTLQKIEITKKPTNFETTEYFEGDELNLEGIEVTAYYSDATIKVLSENEYEVSGNKLSLSKGENTITVSYENKTDSFTVTAKEKTSTSNSIKSIKIKTFPEVLYIEGDSFNPNGLVLEVEYENGKIEDIQNGYTLKDDKDLKINQTIVTVEYGEKTVDIPISVEKKALQSIVILTAPDKIEYTEGETFKTDGMVVEAVYQRNRKETIEDYTVTNGENLKSSQTTVTIKYQDKTVSQKIVVKAKTEEPQDPDKTEIQTSDFGSVVQHTKAIRAYLYTDKSKKQYEEIDIEIDNIKKAEGNDSYEYYYYLAPKTEDAKDIKDWIKIDNAEIKDGKLKFTINTKDISNYGLVSESDSIYLYIEEVVKKDGKENSNVYGWAKLEKQDADIKVYLDDKLKETIDTEVDKDKTVAPIILPNTGTKIAVAVIIIVSIFGIIKYIKYRKLKEIK